MFSVNAVQWNSLGKWSPIAFAIGGLALLINVLLEGLTMVSSMTIPGWLGIFLGLGGIWIVLIGLLGFYPRIADFSPQLSLVGVVTGALGWVVLSVGLGWGIILDLTTQTTIAEGPPLGTQIFISAIILTLLSFLFYGVASSRTNIPSRITGYLLLLPFVAFLILILLFVGSNAYGIEPPDGVLLALFGIAALAMITVGYVLRIQPPDLTDQTSESATE